MSNHKKFYTPTGKFKKGYYHFEYGMGYRFFYPILKNPSQELCNRINNCSFFLERITEEPEGVTYIRQFN